MHDTVATPAYKILGQSDGAPPGYTVRNPSGVPYAADAPQQGGILIIWLAARLSI